jgi:glycosyltransferase involved in cell wall biosynthesis
MNVALLMIGIPDLSGGGGAERFFADLFSKYNSQDNPARKLFLITDGIDNLQKVGKLKDHLDKVFYVEVQRDRYLKRHTEKTELTRNWSNKLRDKSPYSKIQGFIETNDISIIHVPLYERKDYSLIRLLDRTSKSKRAKLVINIVDCRIPYNYYKEDPAFNYSSKYNYEELFNNVNIDGIYSWYRLFKEFAEKEKVIKSNPDITVIQSRYADCSVNAEFENKQDKFVWAARMDEQKNPLFFVDAVNILVKDLCKGDCSWKFEMYGKGRLKEQVADRIKEHGLENYVSLGYHGIMSEVVRDSKCFVSTQDFENFPSLSMAEAMANANAVIARKVGQTDYFVKEGVNGFLLKEDSSSGMAQMMYDYIAKASVHQSFAAESVKLIDEVHTVSNFIKQTDEFWDQIIATK